MDYECYTTYLIFLLALTLIFFFYCFLRVFEGIKALYNNATLKQWDVYSVRWPSSPLPPIYGLIDDTALKEAQLQCKILAILMIKCFGMSFGWATNGRHTDCYVYLCEIYIYISGAMYACAFGVWVNIASRCIVKC